MNTKTVNLILSRSVAGYIYLITSLNNGIDLSFDRLLTIRIKINLFLTIYDSL